MARPTRRNPAYVTEPLRFHPVTRASWHALEAFFETPGAPKYCWCMVWRRSTEEARRHAGHDRKGQMKARIDGGAPVGLLAYCGDTPVAWVSIAPRETYRALGGPQPKAGEAIWSLVCFYIPRPQRGQGLSRQLIAGAVDYARENGATHVEAYPVEVASPSYRFMGFVPAFAAAGFVELGGAGARRHVMRLALR